MGVNFLGSDDMGGAAAEIDAIRRGDASTSDLEAAATLVDRISSLMVSVATGGPQIKTVDVAYKREHPALAAVLRPVITSGRGRSKGTKNSPTSSSGADRGNI